MQWEIIDSVLSGNDTLGLLPTGGGKSITFQVPALMMPGLTVVITPLISLMKDQVDNLRQRGIKATYLHSGLTRSEHKLAIDRCLLGKVKLLYLSPEKLQSATFIDTLRDMPVSLIVVDEAHCISQWGYDFRPSYLKIAQLRKIFPQIPVLALTASATPEVVADIKDKLQFRNGNVFRLSFKRANISYIVRYGDDKAGRLLRVLQTTRGSAIVYVRSRKRTREIAELLLSAGISADFYHAGIDIEAKNDKQNRWKQGIVRVIVATNAFGMGIDKPDVRVVVHWDLSSSLEEYYQEAGRAGRDGKPSFAVILASQADKSVLSRRVSEAFPPKKYISEIYEKACVYAGVAVGSGYNQVFDFNVDVFCVRFKLQPKHVKAALRLLTAAGYFEFIEDAGASAKVIMLVGKQELYDLNLTSDEDKVLHYILRTYTGLFADYVNISEQSVSFAVGLSQQNVYEALLSLNRRHVMHFIPRRTMPYLFFTTSREDTRHVQMPYTVYEEMQQRMIVRIEAMKQFVFGSDRCRVSHMLRYFGENPEADCGCCDVCRQKRKPSDDSVQESDLLRRSILYMCRKPNQTVNSVVAQAAASPQVTIAMIRSLIDENELRLNHDGSISVK